MVNRKLLYIINPIAGTGNAAALERCILAKQAKVDFPFAIEYSNPEGNYQTLFEKVKNQLFTDIIIAGGDGTVNQVINAFRSLPVQFGIIPVGSGNGLARASKIPTNPVKAIRFLFENLAFPTDGFLVNNYFSCMLSGVGFDGTVAHSFAKRSTRGLLTYCKEVMGHYSHAKTYSFTIKVEETVIELEAFLISVANANQYGNNFTIAPAAKLNDGLLDVVVVGKQSKLQLLVRTILQLIGVNKVQPVDSLSASDSILYFQTPSITILNHQSAAAHIDGDPIASANTIQIQVVPNAFRLIRNNN
ncbi:MAG: YegS/Rv2252/BmrU family lipid kinase [Bacteroidetes bacterium]|nr:YegS/Rv2252/BmrU family lipid kinase [Bacteroidota bacterium]